MYRKPSFPCVCVCVGGHHTCDVYVYYSSAAQRCPATMRARSRGATHSAPDRQNTRQTKHIHVRLSGWPHSVCRCQIEFPVDSFWCDGTVEWLALQRARPYLSIGKLEREICGWMGSAHKSMTKLSEYECESKL